MKLEQRKLAMVALHASKYSDMIRESDAVDGSFRTNGRAATCGEKKIQE